MLPVNRAAGKGQSDYDLISSPMMMKDILHKFAVKPSLPCISSTSEKSSPVSPASSCGQTGQAVGSPASQDSERDEIMRMKQTAAYKL